MANKIFLPGFTLIEVVVASALLITVSVVGVVAYRNYADSQKLQNTTLEVSLMLQKAKSRAQTQVRPSNLVNCQNNGISGYEVRLCNIPLSTCTSSEDYELHVRCGNASDLVESKKLPSTITFTNNTSPIFFFRVLQGSVNSGFIRLNENGNQKVIQISGLGDITIN